MQTERTAEAEYIKTWSFNRVSPSLCLTIADRKMWEKNLFIFKSEEQFRHFFISLMCYVLSAHVISHKGRVYKKKDFVVCIFSWRIAIRMLILRCFILTTLRIMKRFDYSIPIEIIF